MVRIPQESATTARLLVLETVVGRGEAGRDHGALKNQVGFVKSLSSRVTESKALQTAPPPSSLTAGHRAAQRGAEPWSASGQRERSRSSGSPQLRGQRQRSQPLSAGTAVPKPAADAGRRWGCLWAEHLRKAGGKSSANQRRVSGKATEQLSLGWVTAGVTPRGQTRGEEGDRGAAACPEGRARPWL